MAVSYKDREPPNTRIWLAKIDLDGGVDFSIEASICYFDCEKVTNKMYKNNGSFFSTEILTEITKSQGE